MGDFKGSGSKVVDMNSDDYRVIDLDNDTKARFDSPYAALKFLRRSLMTGTQKADTWVVIDGSGQVLAQAFDAMDAH